MVAVAAKIVDFLPQRVAVRRHFGEVLSQSKHLSLQHGEREGQFISSIPPRRPEFLGRCRGGFGSKPASARSELIFVAADW